MEFFFTLIALYLAQCLIWVAPNESIALFRCRAGKQPARHRAFMIPGGGWRLGNPLPTAITLGGHDAIPVDTPAAELESLGEKLDRAIRDTRSLRWVGCAQLLLVGVVGPSTALLIGPEAAILFGVAPFSLLHLIGLALMFRAHKVVLADLPGLASSLFMASLYPPALMRAGTEMLRRAFADRSFVEIVALMLDDEGCERFLRLRLGRVENPRFQGGAAERRYLLDVAHARGFDASELLSPRRRLDDSAGSYCEACGQDYRVGFRFCGDCEVETRLYDD